MLSEVILPRWIIWSDQLSIQTIYKMRSARCRTWMLLNRCINKYVLQPPTSVQITCKIVNICRFFRYKGWDKENDKMNLCNESIIHSHLLKCKAFFWINSLFLLKHCMQQLKPDRLTAKLNPPFTFLNLLYLWSPGASFMYRTDSFKICIFSTWYFCCSFTPNQTGNNKTGKHWIFSLAIQSQILML